MLDLGLDLNVWPWVWLGIAVFFAILELTVMAGSFVLLPFSISAFAASLLGFYDVAIEIQWFVFAVGGRILWVVLYRYAKKFAGGNETAPGVGADRLVGLHGIVTVAIDPDDTERRGRVTAHGEIWGAISATGTRPPAGHARPHPRGQRHQGHRRIDRRAAAGDITAHGAATADTTARYRRPQPGAHMNPIAIVLIVIAVIGIGVLVGSVEDRAAVPARTRRTAGQVQDRPRTPGST